MERRTFLSGLGALGMASMLPAQSPKGTTAGHLTLLHTNDTHSRIEPFGPGNGSFSGKGGIARRATLVKQLRKELGNTLLLDAGDVFQGTPYFNLYKGKLDYQLMSMVGYDAGTLGNHDFDGGVEDLLLAMEAATFPFVNCNFDMKGAPALAKRVSPYIIKEFPGIKVGITGVGVDFKGLVAPKNHAGLIWKDPVESLKPLVQELRQKHKVDVVVLLSHLGHETRGGANDLSVAKLVPGLDVIIGGHSHTFLEAPVKVGETHIFQVGFGGINLGRMDLVVASKGVSVTHGSAVPVKG